SGGAPIVLSLLGAGEKFPLADNHGLWRQEVDDKGTVEYSIFLGGGNVVVKSTSLNQEKEQAAALNAEFCSMALKKIKNLEERFGIAISRDGVIKYGKPGSHLRPHGRLDVRTPVLGEVLALEYALERSLPAYDGKARLQILFPRSMFMIGTLAEW